MVKCIRQILDLDKLIRFLYIRISQSLKCAKSATCESLKVLSFAGFPFWREHLMAPVPESTPEVNQSLGSALMGQR